MITQERDESALSFPAIKAADAFGFANLVHDLRTKKGLVDLESKVGEIDVVWNYFQAGIGYFLTQVDPHLRQVAAEARIAFGNGKAAFAYEEAHGVSQRNGGIQTPNQEALVFVPGTQEGQAGYKLPTVIAGPQLVAEAQKTPLALLVKIAANLSLVRDYAGLESGLEPPTDLFRGSAMRNAHATATRFIAAVLKEDPRTVKSLFGQDYRSAL